MSEDFNYFIRNLRKFHQKLQTELEAAGINGAWDEIPYILSHDRNTYNLSSNWVNFANCIEFFSRYDVFIGNKMNFLQYCNVVLVAQNVTELILTKPQEVRIDQLEIVRKKSGIDTDIAREPVQWKTIDNLVITSISSV